MPGVRVPQPGCTPVVLPITPEAALPGLSYRPGVWACLQVALLALLKTALPLAPLLGEPHNPGGRLPITAKHKVFPRLLQEPECPHSDANASPPAL